MDLIKNRRNIIDRKALTLMLAELGPQQPANSAEQRGVLLTALKNALGKGREVARTRFDSGQADGEETQAALAYLIDQIVRILFDFTVYHVYRQSNPTVGEKLSVVAIGGYGRAELAPFSDIDLLFLFPYKQTAWGEQVVEYMLYLLWDLGLKVGHSTRSVNDCIRLSRDDITIRTALLEARWIWGEQDLFAELRTRFQKEVVAKTGPEFIEAKLQERNARHQRLGDSRYMVEPNLKEGKGGLRDLHTLFWIAKYLYRTDDLSTLVARGILEPAELRRFTSAQKFLWTVRCHLHYIAGRAEERRTLDVQREIAQRMGYADRPGARAVERFMKHYYLVAKDVGDLTRIFVAALEDKHKKRRSFALLPLPRRQKEIEGFLLTSGRLSVKDGSVFARDPVKMLRLFHLAQARDLDIHPDALRYMQQNLKLVNAAMRADPEANQLFMEMLTSPKGPEITLRRLNEAGLLGRFVPDFGRVVAQSQFDMYHTYTVDEHTIRAIGMLWQIERGEFAKEHPLSHLIIHQIQSRRALYVAVLLHDIAKGRGGDHSILGEKVAEKFCPRFGMTPAETELVAWLVRYHLAMSATAFKRDIADPKTVADFTNLVQSPERLRMLLLLTVVDIRAVGPTVWNGWKGQLLREIYYRAEEVLTGGHAVEGQAQRVAVAIRAMRDLLPDWNDKEATAYAKRHYSGYWLGHDTETLARHARMVRDADRKQAELTVENRSDQFRAVTELTLYAGDHPGLFARTAGAIAASGATIVDAKIFTTNDGMALDTFFIQDAEGGAFDQPNRLARLTKSIERTLRGEFLPKAAMPAEKPGLPSRTRVFRVPPLVLIDNNASNRYTVIEVNGRDRPGFLYDVTKALYDLSLSIGSAHVATYGERAVDVFYVKDLTGMKVIDKPRLAIIEKRLLDAIEMPEQREAAERDAAPKKRATRRAPAKAAAAE